MASTTNMKVLPNEIWTEICGLMSVNDRKSARMTCQQLKTCSSRRGILKTELLDLQAVSDLSEIVDTLLNSERSVMNLRFSNHVFKGEELRLWHECGQFIEHLELENCSIRADSMTEILNECRNLSHLSLKQVHFVDQQNVCRFGHTFTRFSLSGVQAMSVKTLVLDINEILSLSELKSLLTMFPNVTDLDFNLHHMSHMTPGFFQDEIFQLQDYDDDDKSYSCKEFARCLAATLLKLERVKVKTPSRLCKCDGYVMRTRFLALKTAEFHAEGMTHYDGSFTLHIPIYSFCPELKSTMITSIEFSLLTRVLDIIQDLRDLTSLKKIKIATTFGNRLSDFVALLQALANSKVESVTIESLATLPDTRSFLPALNGEGGSGPIRVNNTVKELKLETSRNDTGLDSLLLSIFAGLEHFEHRIRGRKPNLTNILQHKKLKKIVLESDCGWESYSQSIPHPPKNMPTLSIPSIEFLSLEICVFREMLIQRPCIYFSNLRFLHITSSSPLVNRCFPYKIEPLRRWEIECLPLCKLEGVYMDLWDTKSKPIRRFFAHAENFPRIKYIKIRLAKPVS